jgi:hypothetical protein
MRARTTDWFGISGGDRAAQVGPCDLAAYGIAVRSATGVAGELRELLRFATLCALHGVEHLVESAEYASGVCTVAVSAACRSEREGIRRAASLALSRFRLDGDPEPSAGRCADHARSMLAMCMAVGALLSRMGERCSAIHGAMQAPGPEFEQRRRH